MIDELGYRQKKQELLSSCRLRSRGMTIRRKEPARLHDLGKDGQDGRQKY